MSRLVWDRRNPSYDHGVDHGVLYLGDVVVPWVGLISVEERDNSDQSIAYFDGKSFRVIQNVGDFIAAIEAITYPPEMDEYLGLDDYLTDQSRKLFGFSYRTQNGDRNQIHLVWNATVLPTTKTSKTMSGTVDMPSFTWELFTVPIKLARFAPSAHILVDVDSVRYPEAFETFENWIYGTESTEPRLPSPSEIFELFDSFSIFKVIYNEDGTWTAEGPDDWISVDEDGSFEILTPSAAYIAPTIYQLSSY